MTASRTVLNVEQVRGEAVITSAAVNCAGTFHSSRSFMSGHPLEFFDSRIATRPRVVLDVKLHISYQFHGSEPEFRLFPLELVRPASHLPLFDRSEDIQSFSIEEMMRWKQPTK
jgi:hypothetical protein